MPYFARTFSHSIEEIEFVSTVEEELGFYEEADRKLIESLVKVVFWLKQKFTKGEACLQIDLTELAKSNKLKDYILDVEIAI